MQLHHLTIRGDGLSEEFVLSLREFGIPRSETDPRDVAFRGLLSPDPKPASPPCGDLGARFELVFEFQTFMDEDIGTFRVEQVLYPYADAGPVTFTPAGQSYRIGSTYPENQVRSGWTTFPPRLVRHLQRRGLPIVHVTPEGPWAWATRWAFGRPFVFTFR